MQKTILAYFVPHFPHIWAKQNFFNSKYNCANFQKKKKNLMSGFQTTIVWDRHTNGQTWIYRTLPAEAGAPKISVKQIKTIQENGRKGVTSAAFLRSMTLSTELICSKKIFFVFSLPFIIYLCGFDLFNMSYFS